MSFMPPTEFYLTYFAQVVSTQHKTLRFVSRLADPNQYMHQIFSWCTICKSTKLTCYSG